MNDTKAPTHIVVADGKYTLVMDPSNLHALRYGEPWRDLVGDGFVMALGHEIEDLRAALAAHEAAEGAGEAEALAEAVREIVRKAWDLCDGTECVLDGRGVPSYFVEADQWLALSEAISSLEQLIPSSEQPASAGHAVTMLMALATPSRARQAEGREEPERCPCCPGRTFAVVDELKPDGHYGPGPGRRCVECKRVFYLRWVEGSATPAPPPVTLEREAVARIIDPDVWETMDLGMPAPYENDPLPVKRRDVSLRKADAIIALARSARGEG